MIILGIDPGFAIVGIGIIEFTKQAAKPLYYDVITTKSDRVISERLQTIYTELNDLLKLYKPDHAAVEKLFFNTNQKTAIDVAQARGVLLLGAALNNIPVFEYTPLQVKQSLTGYGKADKMQMQRMITSILKLNAIPKPDDAADALAIALCHAYSHKMNMKL